MKFYEWRFVAVASFALTVFSVGLIFLLGTAFDWYFGTRDDWAGNFLPASLGVLPVALYSSVCQRRSKRKINRLQGRIDQDGLTGLSSRDHFFGCLRSEPMLNGVILMVDIDHFKHVNDTYGHVVGDEVIIVVANALRRTVRHNDLVCRYAGDEFVIFLRGLCEAKAGVVAQRVLTAINSTKIFCGPERVRVTVTIGGSCALRPGRIGLGIEQADAALFLAKHKGRNCAEWFNAATMAKPLALSAATGAATGGLSS